MFMEMIPLASTSIDPGLFAEEMAAPALPAVIVEAVIYGIVTAIAGVVIAIIFEKL